MVLKPRKMMESDLGSLRRNEISFLFMDRF
jgi:hypothetical protein